MLAISLLWNAYGFLFSKPPDVVEIPYSGFLDQIGRDRVSTVLLQGQAIEGTFVQPTVWPESAPPVAQPAAGAATPPVVAAAPTPTFSRFTSIIPAQGDDRLLPLLDQHHVQVTAKEVSGGSWLLNLVLSMAPVVLLVGVMVLMGRQAQRSQQNLLGFGRSGAQVFQEERPHVSFADVAGVDDAKADLQEIVGFLKEPDRYLNLGARLPRGVLLIGPPGTGKTLLARAIAGEAGVPFFSISASQFVEMFVGVGASRVRDLFTKAKAAAPAIVFVDELDAVGRERGAGFGGGNDEREQTLNQLLVAMDGFDDQTKVIVLAATNRPDVLDPALLRPGRFDRQVTLGLPDRSGRLAILAIHTHQVRLAAGVDLGRIAARTPGFSGADLGNLANEAALAAARRGGADVEAGDFDAALDEILLGTRQPALINLEERRAVAYHEAGHALVAHLTPGGDPVNRVSIIPHGHSLGVTMQAGGEDRRNYARSYLLGRMATLMGGRAAEEIAIGDATTGAESDLKTATNLARQMVGIWGMSDDLGAVWYGTGEAHPFLGREMARPADYADATAAQLDGAVRKLLDHAHATAVQLIAEHRAVLDALVQQLLEHETLADQELADLLGGAQGSIQQRTPAAEPAASTMPAAD